VILLGSAAGGGLPQWNCNCRNCASARAGKIPSRTQSSLAFSLNGASWFFVNASPDIRQQVEMLPTQANEGRSTAFEAVLLTNADLDHTLGLMVVREGGPVSIHCTEEVWHSLTEGLGFERVLRAFNGGDTPGFKRCPLTPEPLSLADGLSLRTLLLGGDPPRYDTTADGGRGHASAFVIEDRSHKLVVALDVPGPNETLLSEIDHADLTIIDGSFWSDTEMIDLGFSQRTATQMGHWPISGPGGSLQALSHRKKGAVVYSHINNTNPILDPNSPERKQVETAGIVVGEDGMSWELG
jgi:pyrroloquinoline quinone biosynthesis protein B